MRWSLRERAREHHGISVRIAYPEFPIPIFAEAAFLQDLDFQSSAATHGSVEVVDLEPQYDAVAVRAKSWISKRTMIVLHIPTMQLQHELPASREPFIFIASMSAGATEQLLIPGAAGGNIVNANERCQLHG